MRKRNFNNESNLNLAFRVFRALSGRMRGRIFGYMRIFAPGSATCLNFGKYPRLMNTRSIQLGKNAKLGIFARIECHAPNDSLRPVIRIGANSSFGDYVHIGAVHGVHIGEHVLGGSNILITDHSHGSPFVDTVQKTEIAPRHRPLSSKGPVCIEDRVWIGDNCVILAGVTIGEGSIIGAGSIVRKSIPPYTLYTE